MAQKIKTADPWLYKYVMINMIIIGLAALAYMITFFAEEMYGFGLLGIPAAIILCLGLWGHYIFSGYFYISALNKGYCDVAFIRYPFFLGLAGWLLVCSLPNINSNVPVDNATTSNSHTETKNNSSKTSSSSSSSHKNDVEENPVEFINDQYMKDHPGIPYWCNSCGKSGPYPGSCPSCYSGAKKYNPNYKA